MTRTIPAKGPVIFGKNGNGGVGKTEVIATLVHLMQVRGHPLYVIDADNDHQDIHKALGSEVPSSLISLLKEHGFSRLGELAQDPAIAGPILVSAPGGAIETFIENVGVVQAVAAEAGRETFVVWPMDTTKDSFIHLQDVIDALGQERIWVLRNLIHGSVEEFRSFNSSQIGTRLIGEGRVLNFPVISRAIVSAFRDNRMSHARMAAEGGVELQMRLPLMRRKVERALEPMLAEFGL
ncbi:nucleotide-binding protein [Bosea sp. MMO-172]|uniref:nucleotide-binding protein n=1 Tax=Bosea sp. MMO-172 TaxID=3127885 RepID=UPI003017596F